MKPEHLKHYLTSCKGMTDDDALKHMGGLDEEGRGKLEEECKEHLKKLGVEGPKGEEGEAPATPGVEGEAGDEHLAEDPEADDHLAEGEESEEDKEKKKKEMARGKKKAALAQAKEQLRLAQVQLRSSHVKSRLSALRAEAKITPAEIKNLEEKRFGKKQLALHELSETAIDAVLFSYEAREPVIPTGHFGSVRGVDLAKMGEAVKKARLAEMETETLSHMPFTRAALANTREAEGKAHLGGEPAKVVRLMSDDGQTPNPAAEEAAAAARQQAEADKQTQSALRAQVNGLSAVVSAMEGSIS